MALRYLVVIWWEIHQKFRFWTILGHFKTNFVLILAVKHPRFSRLLSAVARPNIVQADRLGAAAAVLGKVSLELTIESPPTTPGCWTLLWLIEIDEEKANPQNTRRNTACFLSNTCIRKTVTTFLLCSCCEQEDEKGQKFKTQGLHKKSCSSSRGENATTCLFALVTIWSWYLIRRGQSRSCWRAPQEIWAVSSTSDDPLVVGWISFFLPNFSMVWKTLHECETALPSQSRSVMMSLIS